MPNNIKSISEQCVVISTFALAYRIPRAVFLDSTEPYRISIACQTKYRRLGGSRQKFFFSWGGGSPGGLLFFAFATVEYCWTIKNFVERGGEWRGTLYTENAFLPGTHLLVKPFGGQIMLGYGGRDPRDPQDPPLVVDGRERSLDAHGLLIAATPIRGELGIQFAGYLNYHGNSFGQWQTFSPESHLRRVQGRQQ